MTSRKEGDSLHWWAVSALVLLLILSVAAQFSGLHIQVKVFDRNEWYRQQSNCEIKYERPQRIAVKVH